MAILRSPSTAVSRFFLEYAIRNTYKGMCRSGIELGPKYQQEIFVLGRQGFALRYNLVDGSANLIWADRYGIS